MALFTIEKQRLEVICVYDWKPEEVLHQQSCTAIQESFLWGFIVAQRDTMLHDGNA